MCSAHPSTDRPAAFTDRLSAFAGRSATASSRAVSPVVGTVLLVGIVVVVAAVFGLFAFGVTEAGSEPAPAVADTAGELALQAGSDGGIVRITHVGGDPVAVSDVEVVVSIDGADGVANARIVNLPSDYGSATGVPFASEDFTGDDILSTSSNGYWNAGVLHTDNENQLRAGSWFEFRIKSTGYRLTPGDTVIVRVVHLPSDSVIIRQELTAS